MRTVAIALNIIMSLWVAVWFTSVIMFEGFNLAVALNVAGLFLFAGFNIIALVFHRYDWISRYRERRQLRKAGIPDPLNNM